MCGSEQWQLIALAHQRFVDSESVG